MKRLYRVEKNKVLGGVCGGLAEYFEVDPVLIRVLFIVLFFGWGMSLIAYIILWIVAPKKSDLISEKSNNNIGEMNSTDTAGNDLDEIRYNQSKNNRILGGWILILTGTIWLFSNLFEIFDFSMYLPVMLILLGIFILLNQEFSGQSAKKHIENI